MSNSNKVGESMSMKISLQHTDVIMSYRGNTPDREENLYALLRHFDLTYQDYRILLIEADAMPKFDWKRLSDTKVNHIFIPNSGLFPKALLYNTAAKMATSPLLIFNDVDCFAEPQSMGACVHELLNYQAHDVLCPYNEMINVSGSLKQKFVEQPIYDWVKGIHKDALTEDTTVLYERNPGGVFIFKRKDFIRIGGLNTKFLGWGGEDNELLFRATRLGLRWSSLSPPLFHLHHDSLNRAEWGNFTPEGQKNGDMARMSESMPIDKLKELADELHQFFV